MPRAYPGQNFAYPYTILAVSVSVFFTMSLMLTQIISGGVGNPCPSDCWTWDQDIGHCQLKTPATADCFTITCNFDNIDLEFSSKLFHVDDNQTPNPFDKSCKIAYSENLNIKKLLENLEIFKLKSQI